MFSLASLLTLSTAVSAHLHIPVQYGNAHTQNVSVTRSAESYFRDDLTVRSRHSQNNRARQEARAQLAKRQTATTIGNGARDFWYGLYMNFGTPAQSTYAAIDTGSPVLWVTDVWCTGSGCTTGKRFDHTKSSTYVDTGKPMELEYWTGDHGVAGVYAKDVAGFSDLEITAEFGLATSAFGGESAGPGMVGWSLPQQGMPAPWYLQYEAQHPLPQKMFGLYLARQTAYLRNFDRVDPSGGKITLGGYDASFVASGINWNAVIGNDMHWRIRADSITIGDTVFPLSGNENQGIVDSGNSLVYGPQRIVDAFYAAIPGTKKVQVGPFQYQIPCTTQPKVSFTFNGVTYPIYALDWVTVIQDSSGTACYGGLMSSNGLGNPWNFGDIFMKNIYTIFDWEQRIVGFARLTPAAAKVVDPSLLKALYGGDTPAPPVIPSAAARRRRSSKRRMDAPKAQPSYAGAFRGRHRDPRARNSTLV